MNANEKKLVAAAEETRNLSSEELADVDGGLMSLASGYGSISLVTYSAARLVPKMPAGPYEWS